MSEWEEYLVENGVYFKDVMCHAPVYGKKTIETWHRRGNFSKIGVLIDAVKYRMLKSTARKKK